MEIDTVTKKLAPTPVGAGLVRLKDVIALHQKYTAPGTLPENIGDSFLYTTNPVYRNVRLEFLRRGFRFTLEDKINYFSFPVMCLDHIYATREVPYRANAGWLETLEARAPGRFDLDNLRSSDLCQNYLFHESAHCIVHSLFFENIHPHDVPRDPHSLLLSTVGESVASAVEVLSRIFVISEVGRYFLDFNTAFIPGDNAVANMVTFGRDYGFRALTKALIYGLLYSNFMYNRLDRAELDHIGELAGIPSESPIFREVVRTMLTSSEQFRAQTSILYLAQQGYSDDTLRTFDTDPFHLMTTDVRDGIDRLADIAASGLAKEFS